MNQRVFVLGCAIFIAMCLTAWCLAINNGATQSVTTQPTEMPEVVTQQIALVCDYSAAAVLGKDYPDYNGQVGFCISSINSAIANYGSWPGPGKNIPTHGYSTAKKIVDGWASLDASVNTEVSIKIVEYYMCEARMNLQGAGILIPPSAEEPCEQP